jgi:uncharacterized membrane protein
MSSALVTYYALGWLAMFLAGAGAFWFGSRFAKEIPARKILYVLIGLSAFVVVAQILKFHSLHMYVDVAHWGQIVHSIATNWTPSTLNHEFIFPGTQNYFSVHFVPLIYIFGVLYKIVPTLETLLIANGIIMLSSGIPLYLLAKKLTSNKTLSLLFMVALLWYPTFQYITMYEFEMLRFSIPIILWMLYFLESKRMPFYYLFAVLAVMVREEVGLTIASFGVFLFFFAKKRLTGFATTVIGLGAFAAILFVIIPSFNSLEGVSYLPTSLFKEFGSTPFEILTGMFTQPLLVLQTVFDPIKVANIGMLFASLMFLPLLSPSVLISTLGNVGVNVLSEASTNTSYFLYYLSPSIPFLFYAAIKAWPRVNQLAERYGKLTDITASKAVMASLLAVVFVSNIVFGASPISLQFWFKDVRPAPFRTQNFHRSVYYQQDRHETALRMAALIPDDAIIAAQQFLHPLIYEKRGSIVLPEITSKDKKYEASYILFDSLNNEINEASPAFVNRDELENAQKDSEWVLLFSEDSYELYRKADL